VARDIVRLLALALFALLAASVSTQAQSPASLGPGVPQALAEERARRVSDLRYELSLRIPPARSERVTGRVTITFVLAGPNAPLALDFEPGGTPTTRNLTVNAAPLAVAVRDGHLVLPAASLRTGANQVRLDFVAGDTPLNRSDDFLYSIFVPARAHEAFPAFDQPDLKARWTLTLDVPDGWVTLGNGQEVSRQAANGRAQVAFAETAPISTYVFAFAAGRFSVEEAERNGRTIRILHRETDAAKVARNRQAIFDLHASALEWMERYTGIPYPFGKFDLLLVPAFQFGGMEHVGAVFYNAPAMMLEESATQNDRLERASTIAHETAHMWFGDLVTMRWFSDVWMKEVFANFMAAKIVNPSFPAINHELRFLHAYYPAAYGVDRTEGTNAIRQPLDNLKNAGALYGPIIYQKAPIVMRQLESLVGEEPFRDGLREYLRAYAFRNASWADLIAILDAKSPDDLSAWSRAWVEERGRPIVRTSLTIRDGVVERLAFVQADPYPARGLTWTQDAQVILGYDDHLRVVPVRLQGATTNAPAARGLAAPRFVLLNGGGRAYGEIHLDAASVAWLSTYLPDVPEPLTRGAAWITLWDAMLNRELPPGGLLDLALAALPRETDELNVQRILSYLTQTFWTFLPNAERQARSTAVEAALRSGLANATTVSMRSSYFSALRNVATTPDTVAWLTRVWRREATIEGLPFAETDDIVLAQELAVRGGEGWKQILDEQIARTQNPDRRARLQFVAPALSADRAERERFFASLATLDNRRREPWVLEGLNYLHHPLRARESIAYIQPSLELLEEIQQTGDIFFPTRWTSAVLGGHRSAEAAQIVRRFLQAAGTAYPERLRRIILASGDTLFRASEIN
jgi:aminopeptidase N